MLVIVNDSPSGSLAAATALRFCRAANERGHSIKQVFFYLDGVYNALNVTLEEGGIPALSARWQEMAEETGTELAICSAAAHRRLPEHSVLAAPFRHGSLVELMGLTKSCDRLITFGGP